MEDLHYFDQISQLQALILRSEFKHFNKMNQVEEVEQVVRIVGSDEAIEESLFNPHNKLVAVSESAMFCWQIADSDRGSYPLHKWQIDGLFGFMTQIVWPRLVCDRSASRLMHLQLPPPELRELIEEHRNLSTKMRALAQSDIRRYLTARNLELHLSVYEAIVRYDWKLLLRLEESGLLASVALKPTDLSFAIPLLKSLDTDISERGVSALAGMLLMSLVRKDCIEGRFGGIPTGEERRAIEMKQTESMQTIRRAANTHFAKEFYELGTSAHLIQLERTLFKAYRLSEDKSRDYLTRLQDWYVEQIASDRFLTTA